MRRARAKRLLRLPKPGLGHTQQLGNFPIGHASCARFLNQMPTTLQQFVGAGDLYTDLRDLPADVIDVRHDNHVTEQGCETRYRMGSVAPSSGNLSPRLVTFMKEARSHACSIEKRASRE